MSEQRWAVMCSMTGYWGVARPEHSYREDDGLLACTEWESLHDTWAEAMQEADRMARTTTVTLPRNVKRITVGPKTWMELRDDGGVTLHAEGTSIGIRKTHLEKAVLALLAHARKETP